MESEPGAPAVMPAAAGQATAAPGSNDAREAKIAAPGEVSYQAAWDALRAGRMSDAAAGFTHALDLGLEPSLAEDASFWRAAAFGRAHSTSEAIAAFSGFLGDFPRSVRAGEASAMLGWQLVEAGDLDAAQRRFEAAVGSGGVTAQVSGRRGLAELARRRGSARRPQ